MAGWAGEDERSASIAPSRERGRVGVAEGESVVDRGVVIGLQRMTGTSAVKRVLEVCGSDGGREDDVLNSVISTGTPNCWSHDD